MRTRKSLIVAGVVPFLLAPALGMAERQAGQTGQPGTQYEQQQHGAHTGAQHEGAQHRMGEREDKFLSEKKHGQFSAENLRGKSVENQQGEEIGEIEDLLIDRQGNIAGLLINPSEGTQDLIGLSWDAVELSEQAGETVVRVDIDRNQLEQASEFEERDDDRGYGQDRGFGTERDRQDRSPTQQQGATGAGAAGAGTTARATGAEQDSDRRATVQREQQRDYQREQQRDAGVAQRDQYRDDHAMQQRERVTGMQAVITRQGHDHFMADNLIGANVKGAGNEDIGQISDVLLDRQGNVAGVVVGVGGFLGIGERNVALAWDAIELTMDEDGEPVARVNVDKETLENAPEFEERDDGGIW
jgi:sporulation protein YlmC with PRC-barrel domain